MPELKIVRAYHEALRRIGVQNPGEVGVQVPVVLTAPVDDFSHLVPPVQVPVVAVAGFTPAAVGVFSGMEILAAGCRGVWIDLIQNRQNATVFCNVATAVPGTIVSTSVPTCRTGPTPASVVNLIELAAVPASGLWISGNDIVPLRFFLEPGQRFQAAHVTANTNASFVIHFREVPLGGAVEA